MAPVEIQSNYVAVAPADEGEGFVIKLPATPDRLRTPAGKFVASENYRLLLHMVRELEEYPVLMVDNGIIEEPRPLCAYLLFSTELDFIAEGKSFDDDAVEHILEHDPLLQPSAGPEWTDQLRAWEPVDAFLKSIGTALHPRIAYGSSSHYAHGADEPTIPWVDFVRPVARRWSRLSPAGKSVVVNLNTIFEGNFLCALALASRALSAVEFGQAVLAGSPAHYTFGFPNEQLTPEEQHSTIFREIRDAARVCLDYLAYFPEDSVALLVESGENTHVEFKSTLRWDLHQEKKNEVVTYACLKTIAAFLNTDGGTLILGVADEGSAVGIETDRFANDDKFLLHLYGVVKSSMGTEAATLVKADIDMFQGKSVCTVKCKKSSSPVYLRQKKTDEDEFYVRTGPSSARLGARDLVSYIAERFPNT